MKDDAYLSYGGMRQVEKNASKVRIRRPKTAKTLEGTFNSFIVNIEKSQVNEIRE